MSCVNRQLTSLAERHSWRADVQAGFRPRHRLEDLVIAVNFVVDVARSNRQPLAIAFMDLEKAFDKVPKDRLFMVLCEHYHMNCSIMEVVRRMYCDLSG